MMQERVRGCGKAQTHEAAGRLNTRGIQDLSHKSSLRVTDRFSFLRLCHTFGIVVDLWGDVESTALHVLVLVDISALVK